MEGASPIRRLTVWIVATSLTIVSSAHVAAAIDENMLVRARGMIEAGQAEAAREILVPYLASGGDQKDYAEYLLVLTTFTDPDMESPRRAVESFRRRYPESRFGPMAMYRLGQHYRVNRRDPERAIAIYLQLLRSYPQDPLARETQMWLASAMVDAGQYDRAISAIHQAVAVYAYDAKEKSVLDGILDFAKQSAGQTPSGSVTVEVQPARNPMPSPSDAPYGSAAPSEPTPAAIQAGLPLPSPAVSRPPLPAVRPVAPRPAPLMITEETEQEESPVAASAPVSAPSEPYVIMDFRNAEIADVLQYLTEDLNVAFAMDSDVRGKITVIHRPRLLGRTKALQVLNVALRDKGYELFRPDASGKYRVAPIGRRAPAAAPERADLSSAGPATLKAPAVAEMIQFKSAITPSEVPEQAPAAPGWSDEWLKVYPLREANADRLAMFLNTLLENELRRLAPGSTHKTIVISPDRMTNRLIVLGPVGFHEAIAPLIQKLDYKGFADFEVKVMTLKHAGAEDLAAKFENIVKMQNQGLADTGIAQILFQADARINTLILSSSSKLLLQTFTELAIELDQPTPVQRYLEPPKLKSFEYLQDYLTK